MMGIESLFESSRSGEFQCFALCFRVSFVVESLRDFDLNRRVPRRYLREGHLAVDGEFKWTHNCNSCERYLDSF